MSEPLSIETTTHLQHILEAELGGFSMAQLQGIYDVVKEYINEQRLPSGHVDDCTAAKARDEYEMLDKEKETA